MGRCLGVQERCGEWVAGGERMVDDRCSAGRPWWPGPLARVHCGSV